MSELDYAATDFARGAQACREMMARFVEQGGDSTTAQSIRLNWHAGWGTDPGAPPTVIDTWEAPECPEGEADYAAFREANPETPASTPEDFLQTARMLEKWAIPMFPANRHGQIPFVRCMIQCAIRDLRAASVDERPKGEDAIAAEGQRPASAVPAQQGDAQPSPPSSQEPHKEAE